MRLPRLHPFPRNAPFIDSLVRFVALDYASDNCRAAFDIPTSSSAEHNGDRLVALGLYENCLNESRQELPRG